MLTLRVEEDEVRNDGDVSVRDSSVVEEYVPLADVLVYGDLIEDDGDSTGSDGSNFTFRCFRAAV